MLHTRRTLVRFHIEMAEGGKEGRREGGAYLAVRVRIGAAHSGAFVFEQLHPLEGLAQIKDLRSLQTDPIDN